jgi:hypothetical protein
VILAGGKIRKMGSVHKLTGILDKEVEGLKETQSRENGSNGLDQGSRQLSVAFSDLPFAPNDNATHKLSGRPGGVVRSMSV